MWSITVWIPLKPRIFCSQLAHTSACHICWSIQLLVWVPPLGNLLKLKCLHIFSAFHCLSGLSISCTGAAMTKTRPCDQQTLIKLVLRAVPEIILRGGWAGHIFFQTPPPPGQTWSQSSTTLRTVLWTRPPTPRTRPTMDQTCLDPQDKLTPHPPPPPWTGLVREIPPPLRHVNKDPPPHRTKKCLRPTPTRIISGTALRKCMVLCLAWTWLTSS